ncbi:DUF1801 domain-containing protein [Planococcus sp. FY231025]|uniref:DUF1801 domain-containing protein n=1 Tax=Planococcus sp. FY231025 TaxID=3455699 RepID=UPI003F8F62FF
MKQLHNPLADPFFDGLDGPLQETARKLRELIFEASDNMVEEIKWSKPSYSHDGLVCYLQPAKTHINFGFYKGAQLEDRGGLLEGDGTKMRHIRIKRTADIQPEPFKNLIWEAIEFNKK